MRVLGVTIALIALVAWAGGNGVGSGGLNGFPNGSNATEFADGGALGGCTIVAGTIYCPVGKFDAVDAGVEYVTGEFQAMSGALKATAAGVFVGNDLIVTAGNDAIFNRDVRVNDDFTLAGVRTDAVSGTPTVTACSGGTAASVTWANGSAVFQFDVGTSCAGESTAVITFGAEAVHCWSCSCWDVGAATNIRPSACTSTTVTTITNYGTSVATPANWSDGADIQCMCRGG